MAQLGLCSVLVTYYSTLFTYLRGAPLDACTKLEPDSRIWLYSLAMTLKLLDKKHYRARTFRQDVTDNLRNVGVPGTGIPLHLFFFTRIGTWLFLGVVYPVVACFAAVYLSWHGRTAPVTKLFEEQLLCPKHWFAHWRLNSWLVAWHAMATGDSLNEQYGMENKGTFLLAAQAKGIPISPMLTDVDRLFAKHTNMEGGLGIHVLRNFLHGGDWILQPALTNSADLAILLPPAAPLSTLRVITASRHWLDHQRSAKPMAAPTLNGKAQARGNAGEHSALNHDAAELFSVMTVVLRAGRAGALTDHNCVCFPLDKHTGEVLPGRSNQHWYQLGLRHVGRVGDTFGKEWTRHPDMPNSRPIAGRHLPGIISNSCGMCLDAHQALLPDVPLVGWDVALTAEAGPVLLELNISCNFFLGDVPQDEYTKLMSGYIRCLERRQTY